MRKMVSEIKSVFSRKEMAVSLSELIYISATAGILYIFNFRPLNVFSFTIIIALILIPLSKVVYLVLFVGALLVSGLLMLKNKAEASDAFSLIAFVLMLIILLTSALGGRKTSNR